MWITPCKRSAARGKNALFNFKDIELLRSSGEGGSLPTPSYATLARGYPHISPTDCGRSLNQREGREGAKKN